jgi:hypothetical protein
VATAAQYFVAADPTGNQLSNGGETVRLLDAAGLPIQHFTYDDSGFWPQAADGGGSALVLIAPTSNPDHSSPLSWRADAAGGNPGTAAGIQFTGTPTADADSNGIPDIVDFAVGGGSLPRIELQGAAEGLPVIYFTVERDPTKNAELSLEISPNLATGSWTLVPVSSLDARSTQPIGIERLVFAIPLPEGAPRYFVRASFKN